jgi:hypothetical protein
VRKIINILFAALYLFLTTGFTITLHYCGGEVTSISIDSLPSQGDKCDMDGYVCSQTCCSDEILTVKLTDSHKSETKFIQDSFNIVLSFEHNKNFALPGYSSFNFSTLNLSGDSSPPGLYLINCSFLI